MTGTPREVFDYLAALTEDELTDVVGAARRLPPTQLGDADLAGMTPAQINQARRDGRLDSLLGKH